MQGDLETEEESEVSSSSRETWGLGASHWVTLLVAETRLCHRRRTAEETATMAQRATLRASGQQAQTQKATNPAPKTAQNTGLSAQWAGASAASSVSATSKIFSGLTFWTMTQRSGNSPAMPGPCWSSPGVARVESGER